LKSNLRRKRYMLKMKYKLISAAMVIAPILSTGAAATVSAAPGNYGPEPKPVVYKYSYGSFKASLDKLVASGVINPYQESKALSVFNTDKSIFKDALDNLVAAGIINSDQESQILVAYYDAYDYDASTPTPAPKDNGGHKDTPKNNPGGVNKGGAPNSIAPAPASHK
jgi:competence protein ComGC